MTEVLNFSVAEKGKIKFLLRKFDKLPTNTEFEEARARIKGCAVTLYHTGKVTIQGKDSDLVKELILSELVLEDKLVLGFDETGRGENTGPMVVGCVLGKTNSLRGFRDSKKVSNISLKAKGLKNALAYSTIAFNPEFIDSIRKKGFTINELESYWINAMNSYFKKLVKNYKPIVDGARVKEVDKDIEFKVKGDDIEPVIGAASIIAKKARDESENKEIRKTWKSKK